MTADLISSMFDISPLTDRPAAADAWRSVAQRQSNQVRMALKGTQHATLLVIWVKICQTDFMSGIYSKSPVRAICKVLVMKLDRTPNKTNKSDKKWPLFVNKQLFWWSASITLGNNKIFLQTFSHFSHFILYHMPQLA